MAMIVDLSFLKDYSPYDGLGSSDLLKHDGLFAVTISKVTFGKSKSGNEMLTIALAVVDEDERGKNIVTNVLVGGTNAKGEPNGRQFGDLLTSVGITVEKLRELAAKGPQDVEVLAGALVGRTAHAECEAEEYQGRSSSKVRNFVLKTRYETAVAANTHRKPHKAATSFAGTPAGASATSNVTMPSAATISANGALKGSAAASMDMLANLGI